MRARTPNHNLDPNPEPGELWVPMPDWPGYMVSSSGRAMGKRGKILRPQYDTRGYVIVRPHVNGVGKTILLSRLICRAFKGEPSEPNMEASHRNGLKWDNRRVNLVWATRKENQAHRLVHGSMNIGENGAAAKVSDADVCEIRRLHAIGISPKEYAGKFGLTPGYAAKIGTGRCRARKTPVAAIVPVMA